MAVAWAIKYESKNVGYSYKAKLYSKLYTFYVPPFKHHCTISFSNVTKSFPFFNMFLLFYIAIYLYLHIIFTCKNALTVVSNTIN